MSEGATTMTVYQPGYRARHALTQMQSMPTEVPVIVAAMIAVGAERHDHCATSSYIALNGQGACIQGALLQKLGYEFPADGVVVGSAASVATVLGHPRSYGKDGGIYSALAAAQYVSDAALPWGFAAESFMNVLEGHMTIEDVGREIDRRNSRSPFFDGEKIDQVWIDEMQGQMKVVAEAFKTLVPAYKAMTIAWDTKPTLQTKELVGFGF